MRLEFNLVAVIMVTAIMKKTSRLAIIHWFIDVTAASFIIYSTCYKRFKMLQNPNLITHGNWNDINDFLIHSLAAWIASAILEFRTCIDLGLIFLQQWPKSPSTTRSQGLYLGMLVLTCVSSYLMCQYSHSVLASFERFTQESNVYLYFYAAAAAKNLRIVLQGENLSCIKYAHIHWMTVLILLTQGIGWGK